MLLSVSVSCQCSPCGIGQFGSAGASTAACNGSCAAGYFGNATGLGTAQCSGPCKAGYACPAGSVNNTAFLCPPGQFSVRSMSCWPCYTTLCHTSRHRSLCSMVSRAMYCHKCAMVCLSVCPCRSRPRAFAPYVLRVPSAVPLVSRRRCAVGSAPRGRTAPRWGRRRQAATAHAKLGIPALLARRPQLLPVTSARLGTTASAVPRRAAPARWVRPRSDRVTVFAPEMDGRMGCHD